MVEQLVRHHGKPMPTEERETIWRLAEEGVSYKAIAAQLERPQGTVNSVISDGILQGRVTRRYARVENRRN
jgi:DNA-directed RNA polymerase specialized sigma24 family protein